MRRIVSVMAVLLLCFCMSVSVMAAEGSFVPSIDYKNGPEIIDAELEEEDVVPCLVVTSIPEAREKSTDIYQEHRDELLDVYDQLVSGSMTLPLEGDYVIRELVDVSFMIPCDERDTHKEQLAQEGVFVDITFDLGIAADENVVAMVYVNNSKARTADYSWQRVDLVNHGDGTVSGTFEDICPVVFCVGGELPPAQTGDIAGQNLILWVVLMAVSCVAVVVLLINRRKFMR